MTLEADLDDFFVERRLDLSPVVSEQAAYFELTLETGLNDLVLDVRRLTLVDFCCLLPDPLLCLSSPPSSFSSIYCCRFCRAQTAVQLVPHSAVDLSLQAGPTELGPCCCYLALLLDSSSPVYKPFSLQQSFWPTPLSRPFSLLS